MNHTENEIRNALIVIKNTCVELSGDCIKCPFFDDFSSDCAIMREEPKYWTIKELPNEVWRALK